MTDVVIVSAARTPVGSFNGAFANMPAHELGASAIKAALERAGVEPDEVDEVILGQVLHAGQGQNPARQAAINAGMPHGEPGLEPQPALRLGPARRRPRHPADRASATPTIVVAGGQESMSLSPHAAHLRAGQKMGDMKFVDTMIKDGLWDAFNGYHMGTTAENVATQVADHPRGPGRLRRRLAEQGRGGAEGRQLQGRDRPRHRQGPQGRHRRRPGRIHPRRRDRSRRWRSCGPPSPRTARSPPATPRASMTAPPPWC